MLCTSRRTQFYYFQMSDARSIVYNIFTNERINWSPGLGESDKCAGYLYEAFLRVYNLIMQKYGHVNDIKPHFFTVRRKEKELLFSSRSNTGQQWQRGTPASTSRNHFFSSSISLGSRVCWGQQVTGPGATKRLPFEMMPELRWKHPIQQEGWS